jgi:tripartite ATP-independent transporter DctM subunit
LGILFLAWKDPSIAPRSRGYPWSERFTSLTGGWKFILLFVIVIGGIYGGVFTPVEASAGGAFAALVMLIAKGEAKAERIKESLSNSIETTVFILIIIVCAGFYSYFLLTAGVPTAVTEWIKRLQLPTLLILIGALSLYIPLGCLLDPTSCLLITLPLIYPVVVGELGYNPIWFGVIVTKMIEIGLLTPPVGLNVYTVAGVAPHVPLEDIFKGIGWFLVFEVVSLIVLISFPIIATFLPAMMIGR